MIKYTVQHPCNCIHAYRVSLRLILVGNRSWSEKMSSKSDQSEVGGSVHSSTSYSRNFKYLAILCGCTARFVSDLVGNPGDRFCRDAAQ